LWIKAAASGHVVTMPLCGRDDSRNAAGTEPIPSTGVALSRAGADQVCEQSRGDVDSAEECLREAEECERLGGLARSIATRQLMAVAAFQWRKLAEKAAERHPASSFVWPGRRPP